jgi:proline dehydrogenase
MSRAVAESGSPSFSLSFDDTAVAFSHKSDHELRLSHFIFNLTKNPGLVKILSQGARWAMAIGLPIKPLIKATVYRQFCGGENRQEYERVIAMLARARIGTILDYSVEGVESETGFDDFMQALLKIISEARTNPNIPCVSLKMTAIGAFDTYEKVTAGAKLNTAEAAAWQRITERLETICQAAAEARKPLYVDAEESWIQGAIDGLVEAKMATFNRLRANLFTTLQFYRTDRVDHFRALIARARQEGWRLGVKFVRGAYMEKERERARAQGYRSPIRPNKAATDGDYNLALQHFVDNINVVELCSGTHNEQSCLLLAQLMAERGIPNNHPHVYFSQLFGMSDHVSFNLARQGYNVSKYLPFGPVESTLPYLVRRAEENTAIAGQMSKELQVIVQERKRRRAARRQ